MVFGCELRIELGQIDPNDQCSIPNSHPKEITEQNKVWDSNPSRQVVS